MDNRRRIGKLLTTIFILTSSHVLAGTVTYTSSAAFNAALGGAPALVENYTTFSSKQDIAPGSTAPAAPRENSVH